MTVMKRNCRVNRHADEGKAGSCIITKLTIIQDRTTGSYLLLGPSIRLSASAAHPFCCFAALATSTRVDSAAVGPRRYVINFQTPDVRRHLHSMDQPP